jgi:hypothetical protein
VQFLEPRSVAGTCELRRVGGYLGDGGEGEGIALGALGNAAFCAGTISGGHAAGDSTSRGPPANCLPYFCRTTLREISENGAFAGVPRGN